jgi:prepilin-type N-terminal cleavage/methylation domain-containing protein
MDRQLRQGAFSIIELMVVIAILSIVIVAAIPVLTNFSTNQRTRAATRSLADSFMVARSEAIRTGNQFVVFFGPPGSQDPAGSDIADSAGTPVPLLILDDGLPSAANCRIDGGEDIRTVRAVADVSWGVTHATAKAPLDFGSSAYASGWTFEDPSNNAVNWVMFRPDGMPVTFDGTSGDCGDVGRQGTGGAGLYITNGERDYAVVLSPLGGVRLHTWNPKGGSWTN